MLFPADRVLVVTGSGDGEMERLTRMAVGTHHRAAHWMETSGWDADNQWTEQDVCCLSMERWNASGSVPEELEGRTCYGGLDLSSTTDLTAFVLVFPSDDRYEVLTWFWVSEDNARKREKKDRVPYLTWIKQGLIEATPVEVVDYDRIKETIVELGEKYHIAEIAVDRWNATQITSQLSGEGFEIVARGQGFASMDSPTKSLEELILAKKLAHGGNPVLRWMAGNVSIETDAENNWKRLGICTWKFGVPSTATTLPKCRANRFRALQSP